ncbi:hypothetical protein [Streptomyces sp. NPDC016845]|uniref:hypothetical protein n=1 Tax=Streptomyces sp. NPDC016845 TaxID=3364972 RepID=UPI0037A3AE90
MLVDFHTTAQWAAGARHSLTVRDNRLQVPAPLAVAPLPGAGTADTGVLPAATTHGELWLRPHTRELIHRTPWALIDRGTLPGRRPPRRFTAGRTVLWVLAGSRLDRYDSVTLQRLSPAAVDDDWWISDITAVDDDLWLTATDAAGHWQLRHLDRWGRPCRNPIDIDATSRNLRLAANGDRTRLILIDPLETVTALIVDPRADTVTRLALDPVHKERPTLLAADDHIHLVTRLDPAGTVVHQAISLTDGEIDDHQQLRLPASLGRPQALTSTLVLACSRGIGRIVPHGTTPGDRHSTFITPALLAPPGPPGGWNRAEADVTLPAGTAMELSWASTDDPVIVRRAGRLLDRPMASTVVADLERLLPWQPGPVLYPGTEDGAEERLAALLDEVEHDTLWLRIRLRTPPGRTPPSLTRLRVGHSTPGYLESLPALYRDNPRSTPQLRRILAPYEVLLDGLDEVLATLADRLDPLTAADDWTAYLLSQLGFPPLGDLPAPVRRALLSEAGTLLAQRGTRNGLQLLLDLVTDGRATVHDSADSAAGWVLGPTRAEAAGASPARLGHDTVALAQRPEPARAGRMVAGTAALRPCCPDPRLLLAQHASLLTIELRQAPELASLIDRLLPTFVPAHCRVRLLPTTDGPGFGPRLHSDLDRRLGSTTRLGRWPLAVPAPRAAVLDRGARLDAGPRPD